MLLVAGWAREAGLRARASTGSATCGRCPRSGTGRSSPRARTSTPSPTGAATTARWGPCSGSSWCTTCARGLRRAARLRGRGGAAVRRRDDRFAAARRDAGRERARHAARRARGHRRATRGTSTSTRSPSCPGSSLRSGGSAPTPRSTSPSAAPCASSAWSPGSPRRGAARCRVTGEAGHSGEVAMAERHDALAAAAELVLAVERAAREEPPETVATVGTIEVAPGAVSVIPGRARLAIDVRGDRRALAGSPRGRDPRAGGRDRRASRRRGRRSSWPAPATRWSSTGRSWKAPCRPRGGWGSPPSRPGRGRATTPSTWRRCTATLLVFVPLHGGESHTPQEGAEMDEIVQAAAVVAAGAS